MLSAGLQIACGDKNDRETRTITRRLVATAVKDSKRVFSVTSRLRRRKMRILTQFKKDPTSEVLLLKLLRGVRWSQLDSGFQKMFIDRFRKSGTAREIGLRLKYAQINSGHVTGVWKKVFQKRPNTRKCMLKSPGKPSRPTPLPRPRPVTPSRPIVSSGDKQIARQNALVASVRKVYGASTSVSAAKVVLKTQSWSTLKQLGIVKHIMKALKGLGYRRAGRSERVARRLVKKTVRNWKKSSGTVTQPTPQPTPRPRPAPAPAPTPRPRPAQPKITAAQRNTLVTAALLTALKTKGLATTTAEATAFAKGQSWNTVKALQLHKPFIAALNADARLGKWRPTVMSKRNQARAAQKLYLALKR